MLFRLYKVLLMFFFFKKIEKIWVGFKNKIMEFSIKLFIWSRKHFILPEMQLKTILFFPNKGEDTKRGEGGLIKVKKQVDFKIRWLFKAFQTMFFVVKTPT